MSSGDPVHPKTKIKRDIKLEARAERMGRARGGEYEEEVDRAPASPLTVGKIDQEIVYLN